MFASTAVACQVAPPSRESATCAPWVPAVGYARANAPVAPSQASETGSRFWDGISPTTAIFTGAFQEYAARFHRTKYTVVSALSSSPFGSIQRNATAGSPFSSRARAEFAPYFPGSDPFGTRAGAVTPEGGGPNVTSLEGAAPGAPPHKRLLKEEPFSFPFGFRK